MDEQLKKLIEAACQEPKESFLWRKAMHRLLIKLQKLPGIKTSKHPDHLLALNQTLEWVTRKICCEFVPRSESLETSLVNWINGYLYWRVKDLYKKQPYDLQLIPYTTISDNNHQEISLIENLSSTDLNKLTLDGLDGYIEQLQKERIMNIALALEDYIEIDPEYKLNSCYPKNNPHCNCQFLAQKRYLQDPPVTYHELAQKLDIPYGKLTDCWYRKCKPLLQKIAIDLGYKP